MTPLAPDRAHRAHARRHARSAAAVVATTGVALLATACGGSPPEHVARLGTTTTRSGLTSTTAASSGQSALAAELAFSRCMRSHGVAKFPDPDGQGQFPPLSQHELGVLKQASLAADGACEHLLQHGSVTATPQEQKQKLTFGVDVARCVRAHGYPTFPDPSGSSLAAPPGVDLNSPRFQAVETACERQVQKAMGVP